MATAITDTQRGEIHAAVRMLLQKYEREVQCRRDLEVTRECAESSPENPYNRPWENVAVRRLAHAGHELDAAIDHMITAITESVITTLSRGGES